MATCCWIFDGFQGRETKTSTLWVCQGKEKTMYKVKISFTSNIIWPLTLSWDANVVKEIHSELSVYPCRINSTLQCESQGACCSDLPMCCWCVAVCVYTEDFPWFTVLLDASSLRVFYFAFKLSFFSPLSSVWPFPHASRLLGHWTPVFRKTCSGGGGFSEMKTPLYFLYLPETIFFFLLAPVVGYHI